MTKIELQYLPFEFIKICNSEMKSIEKIFYQYIGIEKNRKVL